MKKLNAIAIIATLLVLFITNAFSQSLTIDEQIPTGTFSSDHVFEHIDLTEVPTGILKERATPFINLSKFDGTNIDSFNYTNPIVFGLNYATLLGGTVDSNYYLPDISTLPRPLSSTEGESIPMLFLYTEYNYIDSNAVTNNLFYIQNNQLYDVVNRATSPYITKNAFVATPWIETGKIIGDTISFTIPSGGIVSNSSAMISTIKVDFGDGNGEQVVQENDVITVVYTQEGTYDWESVLTLTNGTELRSHSKVEIQFPLPQYAASPPPPGGGVYSLASQFNIPISGAATVTGLSSCCDTVLRKPIIIIEGFNVAPPNVLSPQFTNNITAFFTDIERLNFGLTVTGNIFRDDLAAADYDLVFIDFTNGTDYLENNAVIVKEVIHEVNRRKGLAGSDEENIIIGVSMGGVLGKLALREMEIAGEDHDTKKFFSFDSPLRGANFPLGMQYALDHLGNMSIFGQELNSINGLQILGDALEILESPAATQLFVYHKDYFAKEIFTGPSPAKIFFGYFESLGALVNCEHLAISNGSQIGSHQGFAANASFVDIQGDGVTFLPIIGSIAPNNLITTLISGIVLDGLANVGLNLELNAVPSLAQGSRQVYKLRIKIQLLGLTIVNKYRKVSVSGTLRIDSAPGSVVGISPAILPIPTNAPPIIISNLHYCFVPTISSLELGPFNLDPATGLASATFDPYYNVSNNTTIVNSGLTTIRSYVALNNALPATPTFAQRNEGHIVFSLDNSGYLLQELLEASIPLGLIDNQTFNYGKNDDVSYDYVANPPILTLSQTRHVIDEDLVITSTGNLWVNRNDLIAFTDVTSNPANLTNQHFDLYVESGWCDNAPTTVFMNGGDMQVGEWENGVENTANVIIKSNAQIMIRDGAKLEVDQHSNIIVKNGGKLEVTGGGTLRLTKGAKVIVEDGGQLIIHQGANIDLWYNDFWYQGQTIEGSSIKIKDGGELVVNGSFNFDGSGFFEFDQGNITTFNAPFELSGNGTTERFIRLNEKATLEVSDANLTEKIILTRGLVEYLAGSRIHIGINGEAEIQQVTFDAQDVNNDNTGIVAVDAAKVDVFYAEFNNFNTGIDAYSMNLSTDIFKLSHVYFNECLEGIVAESCKYLDLGGVHFSPYDNASFAMWSYNVERIDYGGSASEYNFSLGAIIIDNDLGANNDGLKETTTFKLTNADLLNNEIGLYVSDDSRADILVTNGSLINGNTYGIKAVGGSSPAFANVTVNRGAEISNNDTGIYIGKGQEYQRTLDSKIKSFGVIEMTCAKLLDNLTGVEGEDLWLNIDACLNSGQPTQDCDYTQTNPNHFKSTAPINKLFHICYVDRTPIPIDATGNYWELQTNTTVPDYISIGTQVGQVCGNNPFDFSNAATAPSTNCGNGTIVIVDIPHIPLPPDTDFTDCDPNGSSVTCLYSDGTTTDLKMNAQFNQAYADYVEEDYTNSATKFVELANISDASKAAYCTPCQHYINIARSRTFYSDGTATPLAFTTQNNQGINQSKLTVSKVDIPVLAVSIFPNPTNGELNIKTNSEQSMIRIIDLHGRVQVTLNGGLDFQTSTKSWAAGIYIVEITDKVTMEVTQQKVVVQP